MLFFFPTANSQQKYPQNYFRNPLDIPMILAGTFGELRTAHFHSGLDIKTQQKEGLKVYTAAEGYVSRIKISNWGYGKALYITHPNGYTTVYAHLKKFNKKIKNYIRKKQYQLEKSQIQLFPKKNELLITKDEVVAFSGSTGGFIAPHLHFEIRSSKTEKTINPMHFGLSPTDTKTPRILHLRAYSLNDSSHVNKSNISIPIPIKQMQSGNYTANKIKAYGTIGFGINTYDQLNGAFNKNGVYKIEMLVNGKTTYTHKVETFSFSESKYINLLIDYSHYANHKRKYQKTFIHPENKLSIIKRTKEKGYLTIKDGLDYQIVIKVSDFKGNISTLTIPIKGDKSQIVIKKDLKKTDNYINHLISNSFEKSGVKIDFSKNTFYDNFYLNFEVKDSVAKIHKPEIPLHKSYNLSFDVSNFNKKQKEKLYIARISNKKYFNYTTTYKTDSIFKTTTRSLGDYKLHSDTTKPKIDKCSFFTGQNLTKYRYLTIRVRDNLSGLKKYRGEIDGKWILMELNVKTNILTYNFNDKKLNKGKHTFTLLATDNVGNTCTFTSSFHTK